MKKHKYTYEKSGVNIAAADNFVSFISKISSKNKKRNKYVDNIGGFGSISNIPNNLEIANLLNKYDTIGIDLVAMCVNDLIVQGATPLLFLDYISINKINLKKLKFIIKGIIKGCQISSCKLVGGETAEMPDTYGKGKFDIAGFSVGIVDKKKILTKNKIKKNNLILAVPSNGVHSNGYSLIRYILNKKKINLKKNQYLKKELIKPTKIYVKEILKLVNKNYLNGCAHITGGGIVDNIKRIIPKSLTASIDMNKIKTKKIFKWIKNNGVNNEEMIKTFNCGVGFCLIINPENLSKVIRIFSRIYKPYIIGKIISGKEKTEASQRQAETLLEHG